MADKLVALAAELSTRRRFLAKAGAATLGGLGMLLCFSPGPISCAGCAWCWTCLEGSNFWHCCECHNPATNCGSPGCSGITNSYAYFEHCCGPETTQTSASAMR
jgi:hypothetical protein